MIKEKKSSSSKATPRHITSPVSLFRSLYLCLLGLYLSQHTQPTTVKFVIDFGLGLWVPTTKIVFSPHVVFEITERERL